MSIHLSSHVLLGQYELLNCKYPLFLHNQVALVAMLVLTTHIYDFIQVERPITHSREVCVPQQVVHLVGVKVAAYYISPIVSRPSSSDNLRNLIAVILRKKRSNFVVFVDDIHCHLFMNLLDSGCFSYCFFVVVLVKEILGNVTERTMADIMQKCCKSNNAFVILRNTIKSIKVIKYSVRCV